jgi:hypothetical protein
MCDNYLCERNTTQTKENEMNEPDLLMQVGFLMMMVVMLFGAHQIADMWDKRGEK